MAEQLQSQAATATRKAKRKPIESIHIDELLEMVVENDASDLHLAATDRSNSSADALRYPLR